MALSDLSVGISVSLVIHVAIAAAVLAIVATADHGEPAYSVEIITEDAFNALMNATRPTEDSELPPDSGKPNGAAQ